MATPEPQPAPPPDDLSASLDRLMRILAAQVDRHRRLLTCIERKRQAIRGADIDGITKLCQAEQRIAHRLGELEKQRLALVGRLTERTAPRAAKPLSLREIAALADPERRRRLEALAETLREMIGRVRRESSIVTAAANALSRHMTGIMQTVNAALSRVGVYERRGRIAVGTQMDFCVDVKS
ncbi:MAG: flagellar protein FlgN [Planctomycetota bacterium]|nr:flagellar protein FlgN [Planctomycetota bacterium]